MGSGEGSGYTPVMGCDIHDGVKCSSNINEHRGFAKHYVLLSKRTNFETSLCYDFFSCYNSEDQTREMKTHVLLVFHP